MGRRSLRLVHRTIIGAWLLFGVTVGRAVPPASVEDTFYTELQFAGSTPVLTYYHLGAGGVARKLFSVANGSGTQFLDVFGPSEQFNYVYTPPTGAAPTQATIQFSGGAVTTDFSRQLSFATAESADGTFGATSSFSFASRTGLSGALNVSNRLWIHPGELNITGFVLDRPRWVEVRAAGPALVPLEVPVVVADPSITLYRGTTTIATNDQWGTNGPDAQGMGWIFELVGAFPFATGSSEAALFLELENGNHTIHAQGVGATAPGEALIEVYVFPFE